MNDTDPGAWGVQLELLRRACAERRAAMARALSSEAIELPRRALRQRLPPDTDETELKLRWVELNYGADLARQVRAYLAALER